MADIEAIAAEVSRRLRAWAGGLSSEMGAAFSALMAGSGVGADAGAEKYLSPLSQPVLLLPVWLGESLSEAVLLDIVESGLCGYLHVRVQDDRFDEGRGDPDTALVLSTALLTRHHTLVATHVTHPAYWTLHGRRWQAYAEAMLLERRLANGEGLYDEAAFDRVLDRSRPLVLPGAAALSLAGRVDEIDALESLVSAAVRAHQRFDDLVDASEDFARGRRTCLIAESGATNAGELTTWLARAGVDAVVTRARADLAAGRVCATSLGVPAALRWMDAREAAMETWRRELYTRLFAGVFGAR